MSAVCQFNIVCCNLIKKIMMHGRIQILMDKDCCGKCQNFAVLSTVMCKALLPWQEIARWLKSGEWAIA
jgi:hypothetical protein